MNQPDSKNRLADETSPYLRQHADNPVDWYPWGPEALALARDTDRPVLLSVGYSACHWCHVMAHESFEDDTTAALMNRLFVNIKVDREERPDLDRIYQTAQQLLTQRSGGWPLTMFLSPADQMPFFGGTYFPPEPRHGMPAFSDVLQRVADFYANHRDDIGRQAEAIRDAFTHLNPTGPSSAALDAAPLIAARDALAENFDAAHGGFSPAPKFPNPGGIELLMRRWQRTAHDDKPDTEALLMAAQSLRRMGLGGLFDQVGGGFCRYSVDARWEIPHFEKMLYDNALLLPLYAQMWRASGDEFYHDIARRTAAYIVREMRAPQGGFFSSLDADSEGEEGKFYVWTPAQLREALTPEQASIVFHRYGLDEPANFEGAWHFNVRASTDETAAALGLTPAGVAAIVAETHRILYEVRAARVPPGLDDKILTSWNALAIRGLAIAGRHLNDDSLIDVAAEAVDFLAARVWDGKRLKATCTAGQARFDAYLDDYAFLLDALLELASCRWRPVDLQLAVALADTLLDAFMDDEDGGFFFTANDHETLVARLKPFSDESTPAGNGVAARALQRLGYLLAEPRYLAAAERTLRAAWPLLSRFPHAHTSLLSALAEHLDPPAVVILRGDATTIDAWRRSVDEGFSPGRLLIAVPADATALPAALAEKTAGDKPVAYLCRGMTCSLPLDSVEALAAALAKT